MKWNYHPQDSLYWISVGDSVFAEPDFDNLFPYVGAYWDSTRIVINEFIEAYPEHRLVDQAKVLHVELEVPESLQTLEESDVEYLSCTELKVIPEIVGGKQAFIKKIEVSYPNIDSELTYRF